MFPIQQGLWYTVSESRSQFCSLDVLQPDIMNIPAIPAAHVLRIDGLPTMPIIPLILLKLQAWDHHHHSSKLRQDQAQRGDAADLARLLPIAIRRGDSVKEEGWMPDVFVHATQQRLEQYLVVHPSQRLMWNQIGFRAEGAASQSNVMATSLAFDFNALRM